MTIEINNIGGKDYTLTTDHAASSHGIPVLVDEAGTAYGADDLVGGLTAAAIVHNRLLFGRGHYGEQEIAFARRFDCGVANPA